MPGQKLIIATRGSQLALVQSNWVAGRLRELNPGLDLELSIVKTKGDKILDVPLAQAGGKGLFVKEIEEALLARRADLAVHSMKDMPSDLPRGLAVAAVSVREDARDVLVSADGKGLWELPQGARLGTSSLRRQAQLLAVRPDLEVVSIRGNVQTRLDKIEKDKLAGTVLAAAGLGRLGLMEHASEFLEPDVLLPAVGQGALCIEAREDDARVLSLLAPLNDPDSADAVAAERAFLARLEGGCQVPIAGYAYIQGDEVVMNGLVASLDGKDVVRASGRSPRGAASALGSRLAGEILDRGGEAILSAVYGEGAR